MLPPSAYSRPSSNRTGANIPPGTAQLAAMAGTNGPDVISRGWSVFISHTPTPSGLSRSSKFSGKIVFRCFCSFRVDSAPLQNLADGRHCAMGRRADSSSATSSAESPAASMDAARDPEEVPTYRSTRPRRPRSSSDAANPAWREKQRKPDEKMTSNEDDVGPVLDVDAAKAVDVDGAAGANSGRD